MAVGRVKISSKIEFVPTRIEGEFRTELVIEEEETRPTQRRYTREAILQEMDDATNWYNESQTLLTEYDEKLAEAEK